MNSPKKDAAAASKRLHLLCNAHIDPIWLWRRDEGISAALSTFRTAADFCDEYGGFVFNHNESLLYEWVSEYEPELFTRIKRLVKEGKWHIMGGWYIQPDCLMPAGESIIRQIETGRAFFQKHFGERPETAINFDPFGHSRGLVQILAKCGYGSYIFMRPMSLPDGAFLWRGFDGSEITAHKIYSGYNSFYGRAAQKILEFIENRDLGAENLLLWGVGDHGGGPSRLDLDAIGKLIEEKKGEIEIIHSTPENYFAALPRGDLRAVETGWVDMPGCLTSMQRVKQGHRRVENKLGLAEKLLAQSGVEYDAREWENAQKAFLFSEFHDILPGSCVTSAEHEGVRALYYAEEICSRLITKAFFALCGGQPKAPEGEIPVLVYNPHPYAVEEEIEFEFQLADQNHNDGECTLASVKDENGAVLPTQNEKEESSIPMDWRKKAVFRAKLAPMQINRFNCSLHAEKNYKPDRNVLQNETHFIFDDGAARLKISKITGLLDSFNVNGTEYLRSPGAKIEVMGDNEDAWGMTVDRFQNKIGEFTLLSDSAANSLNGFPEETLPNVRVIENGAVRTKIQASFGYENSFAVLTYTIPKQGAAADIQIKFLANDPKRMYKLTFDTSLTGGDFVGQTIFGSQTLPKDGREVCAHKYCGFVENEKRFFLLNNCTYGFSAVNGKLQASLLRTAVHSAHPLEGRLTVPADRAPEYIDLGETRFSYRVSVGGAFTEAEAEIFNNPPAALSFFPSGNGEKNGFYIETDNKNIILSALKNQNGKKIIRLFNSAAAPQSAAISVGGASHFVNFGAFEVKTFIAGEKAIEETGMLCGLIDN